MFLETFSEAADVRVLGEEGVGQFVYVAFPLGDDFGGAAIKAGQVLPQSVDLLVSFPQRCIEFIADLYPLDKLGFLVIDDGFLFLDRLCEV